MELRDRLFAEIAERLQLLTADQLARCSEHAARAADMRLGEAAVDLGFMTSDEVGLVRLQAQRAEGRTRKKRSVQAWRSGDDEARDLVRLALEPVTSESEGDGRLAPERALHGADVTSPLTTDEQAQARAMFPKHVAEPDPEPFATSAASESSAAEAKPAPAAFPPFASLDEVPAIEGARMPSIPVPARVSLVPEPVLERPAAFNPSQTSFLGRALKDAVKAGASDLHVHTGTPLMMRVDGVLRVMSDDTALPSVKAERVIAELVDDDHWTLLAARGQVDYALSIRGVGRLRVNVYRQQRGLDAVFRLIADRPPTLEGLGLPARLAKLTDYRTGLVLCTGPAGCGKSSTLAALLGALVDSRAEHVITIEDPVELILPQGKSLVNQRQIGDHTQSFARALRAALREDPDVIAITELRDRETIGLALSAAETGHLVLGTLQTGSAAQTVARIVGSFAPDEREQMRVMLAESLRAVISQRLVPKASGTGRVPAIELLMVNTAAASLIRDDKMFQLPSVMQTGKAAGMILLDESLQELVKAGAITSESARKIATKKERFGA